MKTTQRTMPSVSKTELVDTANAPQSDVADESLIVQYRESGDRALYET